MRHARASRAYDGTEMVRCNRCASVHRVNTRPDPGSVRCTCGCYYLQINYEKLRPIAWRAN